MDGWSSCVAMSGSISPIPDRLEPAIDTAH
jgi:hypothetical protein